MKANTSKKYFVPCLSVLALAIGQAYAAEDSGASVSGEATAKFTLFDYSGGPAGLPSFVGRYAPMEELSDGRSGGVYGDVDLSLTVSDGTRNTLLLERQGFGAYQYRNAFKANNESLGVSGYYNAYRSASGGASYLLNPARTGLTPAAYRPDGDLTDLIAGNSASGYFAQFNDGTDGTGNFKTDRETFGVGLTLKPEALGEWGSVSVKYDGYRREGNKFMTTVLGGGDIRQAVTNAQTSGRVLQRWWGLDQQVEETMNRVSFNLTAALADNVRLAYDGSLEKFNNRAKTPTHTDIVNQLDRTLWQYNTGGDVDRPLGFSPDSTLITNNLRLSGTFGSTAVAAGLGMSTLEQDSFIVQQVAANWKGEISNQNAFLNVNHRLNNGIGLEGFVKYANRDNDSSLDAPGILDRNVIDEWGVRIAAIESTSYGLSAKFSGLPAKSTVTVGWKGADVDRELLFNNYDGLTSGTVGQWPTMAMLRDKTESNEIYVNWIARPMAGMTVRVTPSWISADKTGYVTEPEESLNLKTSLAYMVSSATNVSAYYHYKDKENGQGSFTDTEKNAAAPLVFGTTRPQKADDTYHAVGVTVTHAPSEWINLSGSLDWMQNDFETFFFGTNRRRFEVQPIVFDNRGTSAFQADTWSLTLNADYQATDDLKYRASYTWSDTSGDMETTSTATAGAYTVKDPIYNVAQGLAFSVDYQMRKGVTLKAGYAYDDYKDKANVGLDGSVNTLMLGLAAGF